MKLSEWIYIKHTTETAVDIFAQLMAHTYTHPEYALNPEMIEVSAEDENGYAELVFVGSSADYGDFYEKFNESDISKENVFAAGVMLYIMLTGSAPDMTLVELLSVAIEKGDEEIPFVSCENSSLDDIVKKSTNVNIAARPTAEDMLSLLAERYEGTAYINVVENESMVSIDKIAVSLSRGVVEWKAESGIVIDGQKFYPVEDKSVLLFFRMKNYECDYNVTLQTYDNDICYGLSCENGNFFGIDAGRNSVRISMIESSGRVVNYKEIIRPVATVDADGKYIYGRAAEELCEKTSAVAVKIFDDAFLMVEQNLFTDATGNSVHVPTENIIDGFFVYLKKILENELGYTDDAAVTFTVSGGSSAELRSKISHSTEKCGISPVFISTSNAAAMKYYAENSSEKSLLLINCGSKSTEIFVVGNQSKITNENAEIIKSLVCDEFTSVGGDEMTKVIYDSILQKLNSAYNLNMYSESASGLSHAQYESNHRQILEQTERMKKILTFNESVSAEFILHKGGMETEKIVITMLKSEYENLLRPVVIKIRETIDRALNSVHCRKENIETVVLSGGGTAVPSFRNVIDSYFNGTKCRIVRDYNPFSLSNGAAVNSFLNRESGKQNVSDVLDKDLGYVSVDISRRIPVFSRLAVAGSPFEDGRITFSYSMKCNENEKKQHYGELKLYTREKGMEHIECPYDGDAIKYMGKIKFDIPENMDIENEKIRLDISVDTSKNVTAEAFYIRKSGGFAGFLRNLRRVNSEEKISADYLGE